MKTPKMGMMLASLAKRIALIAVLSSLVCVTNTPRLSPQLDGSIRGQVVNPQGQPVAGARVDVLRLLVHKTGKGRIAHWVRMIPRYGSSNLGEDGLRAEFQSPLVGPDLAAVVPSPILADAAGRFAITGLGADQILTALVSGPRITTQLVFLTTERLDSPIVYDQPPGHSEPEIRSAWDTTTVVHGATFTHRARFGRSIAGIVRDIDSGRPIPGVLVQLDDRSNLFRSDVLIRTVSGDDGTFLLGGLQDQSIAEVSARPDSSSSWLGIRRRVSIPSSRDVVTPVLVDFALKRGVWVTGQVTDEATGQPKKGFVQSFRYGDPPADPIVSPLSMEFWTASDGQFRFLVEPGPGLITVMSRDQNDVLGVGFERINGPRRRDAPDRLATVPYSIHRESANTLVPIDPPPGSGPITVPVAIRAGLDCPGIVVDEDGQPVRSGVNAQNLEISRTIPLTSEHFVARGLARTRFRRVIFRQDSRERIAVLEVAEPKAPLVVTLRPWGTIKFAVADIATGAAIPGHLEVRISQPAAQPEFDDGDRWRIMSAEVRIVAPGRFVITALAPGLSYDLLFWGSQTGGFHRLAHDVQIESGQTLDLGTIRVK